MATAHQGSPGAYAHARYERSLRSWRSRTRPLLALLLGPFLIAGVAAGIRTGHPWSWAAGVLFGLAAGVWVVLRASPPAYIENWQAGAEGEKKTGRLLRRLDVAPSTVLHDIDNGHGNYDHILIGPAGVFLLDSKNLLGDAYTRDGRLWLRRRHDPSADRPIPKVQAAAPTGAACLHHQLEQHTTGVPWVNAVTVMWGPFPEGHCRLGRHTVIHGKQLRSWLEQQPRKLSNAEGKDLNRPAKRLAEEAPTGPREPSPPSRSVARNK